MLSLLQWAILLQVILAKDCDSTSLCDPSRSQQDEMSLMQVQKSLRLGSNRSEYVYPLDGRSNQHSRVTEQGELLSTGNSQATTATKAADSLETLAETDPFLASQVAEANLYAEKMVAFKESLQQENAAAKKAYYQSLKTWQDGYSQAIQAEKTAYKAKISAMYNDDARSLLQINRMLKPGTGPVDKRDDRLGMLAGTKNSLAVGKAERTQVKPFDVEGVARAKTEGTVYGELVKEQRSVYDDLSNMQQELYAKAVQKEQKQAVDYVHSQHKTWCAMMCVKYNVGCSQCGKHQKNQPQTRTPGITANGTVAQRAKVVKPPKIPFWKKKLTAKHAVLAPLSKFLDGDYE